MRRQMVSLANLGLLSRFVGMLTDSRSFLSFPRHEYFRRILCALVGGWIEKRRNPRRFRDLRRAWSRTSATATRRPTSRFPASRTEDKLAALVTIFGETTSCVLAQKSLSQLPASVCEAGVRSQQGGRLDRASGHRRVPPRAPGDVHRRRAGVGRSGLGHRRRRGDLGRHEERAGAAGLPLRAGRNGRRLRERSGSSVRSSTSSAAPKTPTSCSPR